MKKFIIYNKKGNTSLVEVECEFVSAMEDPCSNYIQYNEGEYRARILKPDFLHDKIEKKQSDGTKISVLRPPVLWSHAFYDSLEIARASAEKRIQSGFKSQKEKNGSEYSEQDVLDMINLIEVVML